MQGPLTLRIDRQTGDSGADRQVVLGKALAGLVMVEMNACNES
jgi:hypothetical protein